MKKSTFVLLLISLFICGCQTDSGWIYDGALHEVILESDRIVVRDGGLDCCKNIDKDTILYDTSDAYDVNLFLTKFNLNNYQRPVENANCCGWPGIDFYKGRKKLATTSLKGCKLIKWEGIPSDAVLTTGSQKWIKAWLIENGVPTDSKLGK